MEYIYGSCVTDSYASGKYETRLGYTLTADNVNNKYTIYAELQVRANNSAYSTRSSNTPAYINGTQVHSGSFTFGGSTSWQTLGSRSWEQSCDDAGNLTVSLTASFSSSATGNYILKSGSVSGSVTAPQIPRAFTFTSATNANVEEQSTIKIAVTSTSFKYSLRYSFEGLYGDIAKSKSVTSSNETCLWTVPNSFYEKSKNIDYNTPLKCTLVLRTYSGSNQIGDKQSYDIYITVNPNKVKPEVSGTYKELNSKVTALTSKLVSGYSNVQLTVDATAKQSASITSYQAGVGSSSQSGSSNTFTFNNITSNSFVASATDSRNITNSVNVTTPEILTYIPVTVNPVFSRTSPAKDNKVQLEITQSKFWNNSFSDTKKNSLTIQYRYREKGSSTWSDWITVTPTITDNTYKYPKTVIDGTFDYTKEYEFECVATDLLDSVTQSYSNNANCKVSVGQYLIHKSKNAVNFGVQPYYDYKKLVTEDQILTWEVVDEW